MQRLLCVIRVGETVRGKAWELTWAGKKLRNAEHFITSVISGRTTICDIDMLHIVGTSSLFNNVMQTVHELMTPSPLHWANITLHFDLVYVVILLEVLVLKKAITGSIWIYKVIYTVKALISPRGLFKFRALWRGEGLITEGGLI